jgi:poly(A) polymerase
MKTYLPYQEWRNSTATEAVINVLERQGKDLSRLVGGAVRNALLNIPINDIDIATILEPKFVKAIFEIAGFKVIETGMQHGTVTVMSEGIPYEITTLRRDVVTDGRHAEVEFTDNWYIDSCRRDFTINAMYAKFDGEVIDFHNGIEDLKAGRIIFVGDAKKRIQEDYLRILRFYRFNAYYGKSDMDMQGSGFCTLYRHNLAQISAERISSELLKTLAAPNRQQLQSVMQAMHNAGILEVIIPKYKNLNLFHSMAEDSDSILMLVSMLPNHEPSVRIAGNELRLSSEQTNRMCNARVIINDSMLIYDETQLRYLIYTYGAQAVKDRVQLTWAELTEEYTDVMTPDQVANYVDNWVRPRPPVNGSDLIELGMSTGKELGIKLKEYEDMWIESDFTLIKSELLKDF